MSGSFNDILNAATSLIEEERVKLIDALIATLEPEDAAPLDDSLLAEINRRSAEIDAVTANLSPWSEVKAHARRPTD
jgi:putative addiction module component (TIGR02574 family)